ncbi:hypothetical protein A2X44_03305 [candidate division CPR3 bacterium GWF2_35_18]|uniref:Two-component response regulator ycbL n=1 Tax=candidate division CPR3 bacterium GW2011_GWF2_35_18 TaxID=1618350 RepID=A0A0G0C0B8_UNCC3|nr:MAG: two-component response regulator ycbL [candidate division CPR3 bacterium GW2011_GWF2_35_18]OGB63007.1 MAG: hypothetical protein A2X44_03305 [candidate division CPR3 bacterium GWF2_35_18]OGB63969.1 MAG: hypothetical protein A2250_02900 [candidate division CPR3 bacterium RIFOXYA2_FULL_35_13]OGB76173.1 MAG: hypothetical protein A2476_02610 [candidate division CPR3 bacterium RIFOXYC2_FULL_35_7]OGB78421.1 MAG: hypothetical protein A2296_03580 [candidate division CPR3 bacterium RIFOXYB2_FULL_
MPDEKKKILLVEDEEYLSEMYEEYLCEEGYSITIAKNGDQGITEIKNGEFDLILLDIMMPMTDGLQVLQALTDTDKSRNGPIVMLSQLSNEPIIKQAIGYGAVGYIIKSDTNLPDLSKKVKAFLIKGNRL